MVVAGQADGAEHAVGSGHHSDLDPHYSDNSDPEAEEEEKLVGELIGMLTEVASDYGDGAEDAIDYYAPAVTAARVFAAGALPARSS
eukprot:gene48389-25561_t